MLVLPTTAQKQQQSKKHVNFSAHKDTLTQADRTGHSRKDSKSNSNNQSVNFDQGSKDLQSNLDLHDNTSVTNNNSLYLQKTIGNQAVQRLLKAGNLLNADKKIAGTATATAPAAVLREDGEKLDKVNSKSTQDLKIKQEVKKSEIQSPLSSLTTSLSLPYTTASKTASPSPIINKKNAIIPQYQEKKSQDNQPMAVQVQPAKTVLNQTTLLSSNKADSISARVETVTPQSEDISKMQITGTTAIATVTGASEKAITLPTDGKSPAKEESKSLSLSKESGQKQQSLSPLSAKEGGAVTKDAVQKIKIRN